MVEKVGVVALVMPMVGVGGFLRNCSAKSVTRAMASFRQTMAVPFCQDYLTPLTRVYNQPASCGWDRLYTQPSFD